MKNNLGLVVDVPERGGSDIINDNGNTVRRALKIHEKAADILGHIDQNFMKKFYIILYSKHSVNPDMLESSNRESRELYIPLYPLVSNTIGSPKILVHSALVIRERSVPVGV